MVVFPTTFFLEFGKETDHQVRASAKSGLSSLTWMRAGLMKPMALRSGTERVELPPVLLLRHHWQAKAQREYWNDSSETSVVHHLGRALISNCRYFANHFCKSTPVVLLLTS